ncbi:hypothetical protein Pelo_5353 [Pelomyxa schiedti]|nr:hypothetical protein Pelo_5353 [Pelomyxa schiedti]
MSTDLANAAPMATTTTQLGPPPDHMREAILRGLVECHGRQAFGCRVVVSSAAALASCALVCREWYFSCNALWRELFDQDFSDSLYESYGLQKDSVVGRCRQSPLMGATRWYRLHTTMRRFVISAEAPQYHITMRSLTGRKDDVFLDNTATLSDVWNWNENKQGLPPRTYRLIWMHPIAGLFNSDKVEDSTPLQKCCLINGVVVHTVLSL